MLLRSSGRFCRNSTNAASRATWKKSEAARYQMPHHCPPQIECISAHLRLKRQRNRREDHRQHDQRQLHDPKHQVDLHQLASSAAPAGRSRPMRRSGCDPPLPSARPQCDSTQLHSAHTIKLPSDRQISHAANSHHVRFGALRHMCHVACGGPAHHRQTTRSQLSTSAMTRNSCSTISDTGRKSAARHQRTQHERPTDAGSNSPANQQQRHGPARKSERRQELSHRRTHGQSAPPSRLLQREVFDARMCRKENRQQPSSQRKQQQQRRNTEQPAPRQLARDQPRTPPALRRI